MADYVDLGEVRTWYDEHGEGEPLALLHPGGADARAWGPNLDALAARFHVFTPERRGHGRTPDVEGPIAYELMAADTIAFLEGVVGEPAHLVGCSAGATVALLVALRRPDLARRVVLVSAVFHRDGWFPGAIDPDAGPPEVLARGYAELSPDGPDHYPVVAAKLARMNWEEPTLTASDLSAVTRSPCTKGFPTPSSRWCLGRRTDCFTRSRRSATRSSSTSWPPDPVPTIAPVRRALK